MKNCIIVEGVTSFTKFFKKPAILRTFAGVFQTQMCKTEQIKIIEVSSGDKLPIYWPRCRYFQVKVILVRPCDFSDVYGMIVLFSQIYYLRRPTTWLAAKRGRRINFHCDRILTLFFNKDNEPLV